MHPLQTLIEIALREDAVHDDVTTALLGEKRLTAASAQLAVKKPGVFSGVEFVAAFQTVWGPSLRLTCLKSEGARLVPGDVLVTMEGPAGDILRAERTLINGLSHACGVATLTRQFVDRLEGLPVALLATRKTLPGLRDLELPAVAAGGGKVHRRSLSDGILIKENHQFWASSEVLLKTAKAKLSPLHRIEIEIQDLTQIEPALAHTPDVLLLDNFSPAELTKAVKLIAGRAQTEASGGVNLETVRAIGESGVDAISVGALTHSVTALDISLDFTEAP